MSNFFEGKIRKVTEEDKKNLLTFSYSRLETLKNCPMRYWKENIENKKSDETTIHLQLGGLLHKVLEEKGKMIINGDPIDYDYLLDLLYNGAKEEDKMYESTMPGINELKKNYFEEWYQVDEKSGMDYNQKMETFETVLHSSMESDELADYKMWQPITLEKYFEYVWKDRVILHGYIDRLDQHRDGRIRTVDYKSSKAVYDQSKLSTSLQFAIYACAVLLDYGQLPDESAYDFILLNKKQFALTRLWEKRFEKQLDKLLDLYDQMIEQGYGAAKQTPLCFWCPYSATNPNAKKYKNECDYYSLWKPTEKVFTKHKEWDPEEYKNPKPKRKLIF